MVLTADGSVITREEFAERLRSQRPQAQPGFKLYAGGPRSIAKSPIKGPPK